MALQGGFILILGEFNRSPGNRMPVLAKRSRKGRVGGRRRGPGRGLSQGRDAVGEQGD